MIQKRNVRNSDQVKISFVLPGDHPKAEASVVGDFNGWDSKANPLKKRSNGTYSTTVTIEKGKRYHFRYQAADGDWFDAGDADAYEPNQFGSENGVVLT